MTAGGVGLHVGTTVYSFLPVSAAAPAGEVEAVVRSPTNMAAAKIAAVDFNRMTSKWRHSTGLLAAMFVGEDLLANPRLASNAVLLL